MTTPAQAPVATIATLAAHVGQTVTLQGWLYNLRASGKLLFPIFRDGTGTIQGIVPKAAVSEELFETLKNLTLESSLKVTGKVREDARAPSGFELDVESLEVVQRVPDETPFPISLKEHGVDFLMEHRHLWLRTPRQSAILRVRATIMRAAAQYFDDHGFIRTDPPILTPNACEGTSELFEMDYFDDDKAYLTQSGQLYVEATALALGKVYSFGPTFRAEKSKTRRHLTEFWMVEPELAYAGLEDILQLAENYLSYIVQEVLAKHRGDLKVIGRDVSKLELIQAPFPRLSYEDAHRMLVEAHEKRPGRKPCTRTATTSAPPMKPTCPTSSTAPSWCTAIPPPSKRSTCSPTPKTPPRLSASTSSPPKATAKSSAAPSAWPTTTCSNSASSTTICRSKPSSGTSTCASTAPSSTAASAWASSESSPGFAASTTSAKPFRSPERSTGSTRK